MTNSGFEGSTLAGDQAPRKDRKNVIIAILAVALIGLSIYTIIDKNKNTTTITKQEASIAQAAVEKSDLQKTFDQSLVRLDSMHAVNTDMESKLSESNSEIAKTKTEIRRILNKSNATVSELKKAKTLIDDLNSKINGMETELARLTQENQTLSQDKVVLTQEKEKLSQDLNATTMAKQDLEKTVDVASTLNASNIMITPVNVTRNGKEKVTSTTKRVDKLVISFDVENRIIKPGATDIFVCVIGPDGKPITSEKSGSGTFSAREDGEKAFTAKVSVDLETAKRKRVEFAFTPDKTFVQGKYTIQIYQNGFKIGESTRELKKGGLFS